MRECRAAMGIVARSGAQGPAFWFGSPSVRAHVGPLQRSSPIFVMARQQRRVERTASDSMVRSAASRRPKRAHEGLPSGQNARLRAGIEKETEGVTLVSTRDSLPQFPLHPYTLRREDGGGF